MWIPIYLLICCEGKTEEQYFRILQRIFRIPAARIMIAEESVQHTTLIDRAVEERERLCEENGFSADEIECWAVCDDDRMTLSYKELEAYAEDHHVHLAFSRPQFEAFLLQHFEQSNEFHKEALYKNLGHHKGKYAEPKYDDSTKGDLGWLGIAIDEKPKIVDMAITNANQRGKQSGKVFLTVQKLVARLRTFSR